MSKKYNIYYWEKESVWVRRATTVVAESLPTKQTAKEMIEGIGSYADCWQSDYEWETSEHEEYDFDTDFEVEEVDDVQE